MKIEYNDTEDVLLIKDELKNQYLFLRILMGLNLLNAIIQLYGKPLANYGVFEYIWVFIGAISLIALYIFLFKKSATQKIPISKINYVEEKSVLERKRYTLALKNGKSRKLGAFHNASDLAKAKALFSKSGITIIK